MDISLSIDALKINGKDGILYGGEFQYFRIPANLWERSLSRLADANVNFISCYIPWIWHEYAEGRFDFEGQISPERDLGHLIRLIEYLDLALLVRPGPYVYGEYQGFGIPMWLREKHPEILMIYETGQKSSEMALNHPVFKQYVSGWLDKTFAFLKPWFENGRIVACQIDNETGLPQFGGVATAGDFNPHTIGLWQGHLERRFPLIEHLNHVWNTQYTDYADIQPPSSKKQSQQQIFRYWAEFIEDYIVDYLDWLKGEFEHHLPGAYFYLNDPYLNQWPNRSPKKAKLATIGFDIYSKFTTENTATHDVPFALSFAPEFYASINEGRLLMGVEVGSGWFDPRVRVKPEATMQKAMISLLRGVRVLDFYLLHDCIEEDGVPWVFQSPLDQEGEITPRYEAIQSVGAFSRDYGHLLAGSEPLHNAIGLLKYIPQGWEFLRSNYTLFSALELMDSALIHFTGLPSVHGALLEAGYNPRVHDLESIPVKLMCQLKVIFFGSTPVMQRDMYQKLLYYVEQGGTLISFGFPVALDLNERPYLSNPLFPARPAGQPHRIQYGNNTTLSQFALDVMNYQVLRLNHPHRLSLHTLDMMHPFVELTKYMGKTGVWLETERGDGFWASRFVSFWQGGGTRPILTHNSQNTVAYTRRIGRGRIVFLGTIPGLFFDTPAYYSIEAEKKQSVISLLSSLMRERGLWPLVDPIPNTETILRQTPQGLIVALINRGPGQDIDVHLNYGNAFKQVEICFNLFPKTDFLEKGRFQHLRGHLSQDAVLVAHLV